MRGFKPQGAAIVLDNYESDCEDRISFEADPCKLLGVTGKRMDTEEVDVGLVATERVRSLILLNYSNKRLYLQALNSATVGIQTGLGMVRHEAFRQIVPEKDAAAGNININAAIDLLDFETTQKVRTKEKELLKRIISSTVFDLARDILLTGSELFRTLGILAQLPQCLIAETPFAGYLQPYGAELQLIGEDGAVKERCPFHPLFRREVVYTIQNETESGRRTNETLTRFFQGLLTKRSGLNIEAVAENKLTLSPIEQITSEVWNNCTVRKRTGHDCLIERISGSYDLHSHLRVRRSCLDNAYSRRTSRVEKDLLVGHEAEISLSLSDVVEPL